MVELSDRASVPDFGARASALVIAASDGAAARASEDVVRAGLRLKGTLALAELAGEMPQAAPVDVIIFDTHDASGTMLDATLPRVAEVADEMGADLVAILSQEQIDHVATVLMRPRAQLLCEPSATQRVTALAIAQRSLALEVRQPSGGGDPEAERLSRLNEEVARIAETLARLTRGEDVEEEGAVREPSRAYRTGPTADIVEITAGEIRGAIRARRIRGQYFEGDLFADPAWDMLLDLFAADLEQRRVSVSSLCIAAAVPPTTALRWISTMHEAGLFQRHADPSDRRRAYIALSPKGRDAMRAYVTAVKRAGLGIA